MNLVSNQFTTIKILESIFDISNESANLAYKMFKRNCWDGIDLDKISILEFDNIESVSKYFQEPVNYENINEICKKYNCYIDYDNFIVAIFLKKF